MTWRTRKAHISLKVCCVKHFKSREPLMFIECKCLVTSSILLKILYHNPSPYDLMYSPNIDHNLHFPHKISFFYYACDIWGYVHIIIQKSRRLLLPHTWYQNLVVYHLTEYATTLDRHFLLIWLFWCNHFLHESYPLLLALYSIYGIW